MILSKLSIDSNDNLKYDIVSLVFVVIFYSSCVYLFVLFLNFSIFVVGICILGLF